MKIRYATLLLALVLSITVQNSLKAQVPSWEWIEKGSAGGYVYPGQVKLDEEGNVYAGMSYQSTFSLGGSSVTNNRRDPDPGFFKMGIDGKSEWAKKLHSEGTDRTRSFCLDAEGRSYLVITISNTMAIGGVTYSSGDGSYILLAYKPNGELRWAKQLSIAVNSLSINADEELMFTGAYTGTVTWAGTEYNSSVSTAFAAAYDLDGNELWLQEIATNIFTLGDLTETSEAYYFYFNASTRDTIRLVGDNTEILPSDINAYYIFSFSKDWSMNWMKEVTSTFTGSSAVLMYGIRLNSEDDVYAFGRVTEDLVVDGKEYASNSTSSGCADGFMVKLDKDGGVSKAAMLGSAVSCDHILGMAIGSDDKVYMVGSSSTTLNYDGLQISLPKGGTFLVKMDADLKPLWDIVATGESTGLDLSFVDVAVNRRSDLVVSGRYNTDIDFGDTSFVYTGFGANKYMFVAKVQNDFTDNIAEVNGLDFGFDIFPNPGNGEVQLAFSGKGAATISISNLTGQELWSRQVQLETGSLPVALKQEPGIYLVTVQSDKGTLTQRYVLR